MPFTSFCEFADTKPLKTPTWFAFSEVCLHSYRQPPERQRQSIARAKRRPAIAQSAASQAGDVATVLGLMADDVVFMVPGREPFGKEAFVAGSQSMKGVRVEGSYDIREIKVMSDWAYLRNYIALTVRPPDGGAMHRAGYTLSILRKEPDGKWVLARDANLLLKVS